MRREVLLKIILAFMLLKGNNCLIAQAPNRIEVGYDLSVVIEFPLTVELAVPGNTDYISATKIRNKVVIRSKIEQHDDTNLIVELTDGSIYNFGIRYNNSTVSLIHKIGLPATQKNESITIKNKENNDSTKPSDQRKISQEEVHNTGGLINKNINEKPKQNPRLSNEEYAGMVAGQDDYISSIGTIHESGIWAAVTGIWAIDDNMYFKVTLANKLNLKYDIARVDFFVREKAKVIGNKVTEPSVKKITYMLNEDKTTIPGKAQQVYVIVVDKFTIAKSKECVIQFWESRGDRTIEIVMDSKQMLKIKSDL